MSKRYNVHLAQLTVYCIASLKDAWANLYFQVIATPAYLKVISLLQKKRRLNDKIIGKAPVPSKSFNVQCPPSPDSFTHDQLFDTLSKNYPSAILTVQEKHCKNVIPRSCTDILPKLVMEYKNSTASPIPEDSIDNFSKTFELPQITPQQIIMVSKRQESSQNQNYGINKELEESLLPN